MSKKQQIIMSKNKLILLLVILVQFGEPFKVLMYFTYQRATIRLHCIDGKRCHLD